MQPVVGSTSSMGEIWRWKIPSIGKSLLAVIAPHLSITGAPLSLIHNGYWQPQQKCLEHWPNSGNHVVPDTPRRGPGQHFGQQDRAGLADVLKLAGVDGCSGGAIL